MSPQLATTDDLATVQIHYVPMHEQDSSRTLMTPDTEAGKAWEQFLGLFKDVDGLEKVWWAFQDDNPDNVGVFAYWNSRSAQRAWEAHNPIASIASILSPILAPDYASFTSKRFTILLPAASASENALTALNCEFVIVWTWWFHMDSFSSLQTTVPDAFQTFVAANTDDAAGVGTHVGGWREEEDVIREVKARSFTGVVGLKNPGSFNKGPPPFKGNIEGRIGLGMRNFCFWTHGAGDARD